MRKKSAKPPRRQLDERVGYRFSVITKRLQHALTARRSKALGISVNHWRIMSVIGFFGPLSASELGERTSLDPDKITRCIDTMVDRGYMVRKSDENDRRKVVLSLSAKGRRVHDRLELAASALEVEFLSVLTLHEQKALLAALDKLERHSSSISGRGSPSERRSLSEQRHARKSPLKSVRRYGKTMLPG